MAKRSNKTAETVRAILADACIATANTKSEMDAVTERRQGAYSLYVQAAAKAGSAEVLSQASDSLFDEIRRTGAVIDGNGKSVSLNCKPTKDGTGFTVPSAVSSAKSVMLDALTMGLELKDPKSDTGYASFGSIRKAVQEAKALAKRETATGEEALRIELMDKMRFAMERIRKAKGDELKLWARLLEAVKVSEKDAEGAQVPAARPSPGQEIAEAA